MEVPYGEGVATTSAPSHASTSARAWRSVDRGARRPAIEPRKGILSRVPTLLQLRKAIRTGAPSRAPGRPCVVEDPGMCVRSLDGNREISGLTGGLHRRRSASGRRGAVADDARTREVRPRHSSWEAGEQGRSDRLRSRWSQGRGPRGTRDSKARAGLRDRASVSQALDRVRQVARKGRRSGSRRCSTTSTSICCGWRSSR